MVADQSQVSDGIYMTVEQYLTLDEATDGKYERLNGMVTMLRPPSSLDGADEIILDMAGGSAAHGGPWLRPGGAPNNQIEDAPRLGHFHVWGVETPPRNYLLPRPTVRLRYGTS